MYAEHAKPMPRRRGPGDDPRRVHPRHFCSQPDASTTLSMHSPRPIVVTVRWLAVFVNGSHTIRRRSSVGSSPSCSAALSICTSSPKRGWGVPWPRLGPHGGLLVNTRAPSNLYTGILYVTGLMTPV